MKPCKVHRRLPWAPRAGKKALQHLSLSQRGTMLLNVVACLGAPGLISGGVFLEGGQIH